jgi:subtilisin family serine protease
VSPQRTYTLSSGSSAQPLRRSLSGGGKQSVDSSTVRKDFLVHALNASHWWARDVTGRGVRIAVFDTGEPPHDHLRNVVEAVDFTTENSTRDVVGHSSFMSGVVAGASTSECPGLAPDAELLIARVFSATQQSTTAWFLEAFNYALHRRYAMLCYAMLC